MGASTGAKPPASASSNWHLILVKSPSAGARVMASGTRFLTGELKLGVNEHKSRIVKTDKCTFLGFTFQGTKLRWSDQAYEDFRHNIRKLTGRSWGVSMADRLHKLAQYVRGWMGYFAIKIGIDIAQGRFGGLIVIHIHC